MTTKIDGTLGITFPDASVQSTAGIPTNSTQISKAWVNFDGTTSVRRSSYNVGSVTKHWKLQYKFYNSFKQHKLLYSSQPKHWTNYMQLFVQSCIKPSKRSNG